MAFQRRAFLRAPRGREMQGDDGFTLIELLVVLLIIGILLAIALPTFLSLTNSANNTAAQSNLQSALTGARVYFTDNDQSYTGLLTSTTASDIQEIATGLSYVTNGVSTGAHLISVKSSADGSALALAAWASGSGDCWYLVDNTSSATEVIGGTTFTAQGTYYDGHAESKASCVAGTTLPALAKWDSTGFTAAN